MLDDPALWNDYPDVSQPVDFGGYPSAAPASGGGGILSIGNLLSAFGTGAKAYGQYQQGQEIAGAYEYNAALTLTGLDYDKSRIDVAAGEYAGTQAAMYAKAGVTMSGSPLDVELKTATNFELDKQVATYNAQSKANMLEYEAKQTKQKANFDSTATLIQGAVSIAETAALFAL